MIYLNMNKWIKVEDRLPNGVEFEISEGCFIPVNYKIAKMGVGCHYLSHQRNKYAM